MPEKPSLFYRMLVFDAHLALSLNAVEYNRDLRRSARESRSDEAGMTDLKGRGCGTCNNTGYKGRVGLYEVFRVTDEVRQLVLEGASSIELKARAMEDGMISLRYSGLRKVKLGMTTMEEVVRETVL